MAKSKITWHPRNAKELISRDPYLNKLREDGLHMGTIWNIMFPMAWCCRKDNWGPPSYEIQQLPEGKLLSNDELISRRREWEKIYPAKSGIAPAEGEIEVLGKEITQAEIQNSSNNKKQHDNPNPKELSPEGGDNKEDARDVLKRIFRDEGKGRKDGTFQCVPDPSASGDIRKPDKDLSINEVREVGRFVF